MVLLAAVKDWAPAASAGLAALAAIASWIAVRQTRRAFLSAKLPDLEIAVLESLSARTVNVHIENYGDGGARSVAFYVVEGAEATGGALPPTGNLPAHEGRTLSTDLTPSGTSTGTAVVICRDGFGRLHAWNLAGKHKRWNLSLPWNRKLSNERMFRHFYPEAPDPTEQKLVGHELI